MDSVKHVIPWISGQKEVLKSNCESKLYINSCHTPSLIQVLQSLHRDGELCAIKLETEDGVIVYVHKVVLVSASPYFRAMFTSFAKRDGDVVNLDNSLKHLLVVKKCNTIWIFIWYFRYTYHRFCFQLLISYS
ncbi:kelch repeat and BTB domain-containing protein 8-like [Metopolophium dirhodum]|uniref:kelch repeat and BTB domain-containing protein 8-like n=1 Tax=Metopolophium dirhodum TaxID=44670 RepID=UPI00298F5CF1|nr:kelch repeat and BTB domain-containing protein 8-like [Metopolophium dirhodum]XP_060858371.1 kelch repeat and BTB domain-containing protein 8-like [Metopolophium dirhodum]